MGASIPCIKDIISSTPQLTKQQRARSAVIVHVGTNIKRQQSELLQEEVMYLMDHLLDTGEQVLISFINKY